MPNVVNLFFDVLCRWIASGPLMAMVTTVCAQNIIMQATIVPDHVIVDQRGCSECCRPVVQ